ncbi:UbiA family prenyltransferase [Reichenbachiella carrageenanivorans]|uniref:UbiA family prenyltransferase n=1 Tax=Reichenbachiella carrageenanivorans TaxID=2979869 RepID=A0ABY6D2K3_9BACT|nr:UbiA family prenyltransferase [Reichenbachiella carrageenanivorans]UXX80139.1 UbiA family prenyltransferase [Reichenbachiella carrageenanivorans]
MTFLKHILSVIRWLSLDVVVGGVIFTCSMAKVAQVELPVSIPVALACCIWLIYTLDHLIDGNSRDRDPSMERHVFHRKYRRPIFVLFLLVAGLGLRLLFFIPHSTLIYGCVLLGLVGLYFLSIWLFKIYFAKEIFIAVLYACGIYLGTFSLGSHIDSSLVLFFSQTVLMAAINLLLFSYYEVAYDTQDGHRSWATHFGAARTLSHLRWMIVVLGVLIVTSFFLHSKESELVLQYIFVMMSGLLAAIYWFPEWFKQQERFRWIGDVVFLFPGLIYLF